jgi:uncharacterized beta-barrel protein YwiB (DUF1934 family)
MVTDSASATPVKVNLTSEIQLNDNTEQTTLITSGQLYHKINADYLHYEEVIEDVGSVKTIIKIKQGEAVIMRSGAVSMSQTFFLQRTTEGTYQSPYGPLRMETTTERMNYKWSEGSLKGEFQLSYELSLQGEHAGTYHIYIELKGERE